MSDPLRQCPLYEPVGPDATIVRDDGWPAATCAACGGDPDDGPTDQCPMSDEGEA